MRTLLTITSAALLAGCGLDVLTSAAVQSELTAKNAKQAASALAGANELKGALELSHAINAYRAEQGQYPPSLDALVPGWLPQLPEPPASGQWVYDPRTGRVSAKSGGAAESIKGAAQASAVTETDKRHMREIVAALRAFHASEGRVPASLWELVPAYIDEIPQTSDGRDFLYAPQNASLFHPAQFERPATPQGPPPGAAGRRGGSPGAMEIYNSAQQEALDQTGF